jgi:hypothetical protein
MVFWTSNLSDWMLILNLENQFLDSSHQFLASSCRVRTSPTQRSLLAYSPPSHPPSLPSFEAVVTMEGESSAISGSWPNYRLTATPATAGAIPPVTCPVTTRLLELYQECVDNGVWARVLYDSRGGIEKLTFLRKKTPPSSRQPG